MACRGQIYEHYLGSWRHWRMGLIIQHGWSAIDWRLWTPWHRTQGPLWRFKMGVWENRSEPLVGATVLGPTSEDTEDIWNMFWGLSSIGQGEEVFVFEFVEKSKVSSDDQMRHPHKSIYWASLSWSTLEARRSDGMAPLQLAAMQGEPWAVEVKKTLRNCKRKHWRPLYRTSRPLLAPVRALYAMPYTVNPSSSSTHFKQRPGKARTVEMLLRAKAQFGKPRDGAFFGQGSLNSFSCGMSCCLEESIVWWFRICKACRDMIAGHFFQTQRPLCSFLRVEVADAAGDTARAPKVGAVPRLARLFRSGYYTMDAQVTKVMNDENHIRMSLMTQIDREGMDLKGGRSLFPYELQGVERNFTKRKTQTFHEVGMSFSVLMFFLEGTPYGCSGGSFGCGACPTCPTGAVLGFLWDVAPSPWYLQKREVI